MNFLANLINCSNIFLDQSHKPKEIKTKINKRDLIKLKSLKNKENHQQQKKRPIEWEKIFSYNVKRGWHPKLFKQLIKFNIKI